MDEYQVIVTPHAMESMKEVRDYISYELGNPSAAKKLLMYFKEAIESFSSMPGRIPLTPDKPWHDREIHRCGVKNYYIYFWIDKNNQKVYITDAIFIGRDQSHASKNMF